MKGRKFAYWIQGMRPQFLAASILPALTGIRLASRVVRIDPVLAALSVMGAALAHLATNVANDYYDYLSGADSQGSAGSRVIQEGKLTPAEMKRCFLIFYAACICIGIPLVIEGGWPILLFGLPGLFLSYYYVGPPLRLEYRGFGEVAVGTGMGPLIILGSYYVQTGRLSTAPLLASLPVGLLVAAILYVQSLPDLEWDRRCGKMTLVVKLGSTLAAWGVTVIWVLFYTLTAILYFAGIASGAILWVCLSVPAAILMSASAVAKRGDLNRATWEGKLMIAMYIFCAMVIMIAV